MTDEISEDWLRAVGFKWHQMERQPDKHWLLWLGDAVRESDDSLLSYEDIGLELAPGFDGKWFCWFRSDAAGRYHRFIHIRHLRTQADLVKLVEAITGLPWTPENHLYGSARGPKSAERIRANNDRFDRELLRQGPAWSKIEKDNSQGGALPEHLQAFEKERQ
jgi:hypothetical protein